MSLPKEISTVIRAASRVVSAHRDLKRARAEEAAEPTRVKYRKALSEALEALDKAVVAAAKFARTTPPETSGKPFDWAGPLKVALKGLRLVNELRGGRVSPDRALDVIDAEIIS
jgi:hypothetical protein